MNSKNTYRAARAPNAPQKPLKVNTLHPIGEEEKHAAVTVVTDTDKAREDVREIVYGTDPLGNEHGNKVKRNFLGVAAKEATDPDKLTASASTAGHMIANAYKREFNRKSGLTTGAKMEIVSSIPSWVMAVQSYAATGDVSTPLAVALFASTSIAGVLGMRIKNAHDNLKSIKHIAKTYKYNEDSKTTGTEPGEQDLIKEVSFIEDQLKDAGISIDDKHHLAPEQKDQAIHAAVTYNKKKLPKPLKDRFSGTSIRDGAKASGMFTLEIANDLYKAIKKSPKILKDTGKGWKDTFNAVKNADIISNKLNSTNQLILMGVAASFVLENGFELAHTVELAHNASSGHYGHAAANLFSILAAALPMQHLGIEISHDVKKLTKGEKGWATRAYEKINPPHTHQLDYYGMPVTLDAKNAHPTDHKPSNDNKITSAPTKTAKPHAVDYYGTYVDVCAKNITPPGTGPDIG